MVVKLLGRSAAVSAVRPQKAYLPTEVTPSSSTRRRMRSVWTAQGAVEVHVSSVVFVLLLL